MNPVSMDTPARALVLLDQPLLADMVTLTLNHGRYRSRIATAVPEAITMLPKWRPHLAVLCMDLAVDAILGPLGTTRGGAASTVPILGLTRRGDLKAKLRAFDQGVDDVMTVPFEPEELLARALVITRRAHGEQPILQPTITIGEIENDILNREVRTGTSVIHLSGIEQSLLYLLAAKAGQVIGRDAILDTIWGPDFVAESNIVDRHVRGLRAKLGDDWRRPRFIATVPGRGYRFLPTSSDGAPAAP